MDKDVKALSDLFIEIGGLIKKYEDNVRIRKAKQEVDQLYDINEIGEIYPKLSKHILTKAIKDGSLPVTWIGNERCFYMSDIQKFLETNTQRYDIKAWRTSEQA